MLRIKRVSIKGFKTFAQQTEFAFGPGVTAIVGPNGCGKSNVADAIRWCLGEQSFGLLRSKKTVDVIFSGSDRRARQGMASVSLVLDNEGGQLGIDFSEVEITRRAYRDGDNEYLINGQRVRLQDITQLLAPSGLGKRAYAVIGQGLIDRVLSLRPEERRALFEEAAGITGYQQKRSTALRRLEATQLNLDRVRDILSELSPRLATLKRQAERTLERRQIESDLEDLLQVWYGYQWHRTLTSLREARQKAERHQHSTQVRRQRMDAIRASLDDIRARQTSLRDMQSEQSSIRDARQRQMAEVSRRLAVTRERLHQTDSRHLELKDECNELLDNKSSAQSRFQAIQGQLDEVQVRYKTCQSAVDRLQNQLAERQKLHSASMMHWREAQAALRKKENQIADLRNRLEHLAERRSSLQSRRADTQAETRQRTVAADQAAATLVAMEAASADRGTELDTAQSRIAALTEAIAADNIALRAEERSRTSVLREIERLQTRLELLQRMRGEGSGYASGVRSVLQASQQNKLDGVLGTVASQIDVPARLERAIEVVLGAALQNVIVKTWQDAELAIEFLKSSGAGRATFLPLDRLRSGGPISAPKIDGIVGNAARSVQYESQVAPAIQHLLQRVWIADDLAAARYALDAHSGSARNGRRQPHRAGRNAPLPTVVTLDGEIIRPGGAVTGGNDGRRQRSSVLAWEKEARELPAALERAKAQEQLVSKRTQAARHQIEEQRKTRTEFEIQFQALNRDAQRRQAELEQARLLSAQARQEAAWQQQVFEQTLRDLAELDSQEEQLRQALDEKAVSLEGAQKRAGFAETAAQASPDEMLRKLADQRAQAAAAQENLNSQRALMAQQKRTLEQVDGQLRSKSNRLNDLLQEAGQLRSEISRIVSEERELQTEGTEHSLKIAALETELKQLEKEQMQAEAEARAGQQLLLQDESNWNASRLALQRTEDRLTNLRREIRQDFGLAEMEEADGLAYQPPLPLQTLVAQLPVIKELPAGLKNDVREARARLRRLSNVNPEAPQEYEEAASRHHFLQNQSDDLENAASDLQQVIRELDKRMEGDLRRTFDAVAIEFVEFFKLLLRGGTAKLSVTDPHNILNTGVEILARPPGKRPQSLDLLSGGERSLTACALVLAILRVSPTPFCVLDEVDATLDEANVDRLRSAMELLSRQTQFIVITHNRRTLEMADRIYGITMGDDGVSRVISLRLESDDLTVVENDEVEPAAAIAF